MNDQSEHSSSATIALEEKRSESLKSMCKLQALYNTLPSVIVNDDSDSDSDDEWLDEEELDKKRNVNLQIGQH